MAAFFLHHCYLILHVTSSYLT